MSPVVASVFVLTVLPLSRPKKNMRRDFASANSLKLVYLPLARKGWANNSRVRFGVKVVFTRVLRENVFCSSRPNTYRVPANGALTAGSATAVTYCWAVLSWSYDGERLTSTRVEGLSVTFG